MQSALSRGIDIVSILRIEKALQRSGDKFLRRIFDGRELELRGDTSFLATRFAAKEAFFKALGTGVSGGVRWHDFVLPPAENLSLTPVISGRCSELLDDRKVLVSVSRTHATAVAVVFLQSRRGGK